MRVSRDDDRRDVSERMRPLVPPMLNDLLATQADAAHPVPGAAGIHPPAGEGNSRPAGRVKPLHQHRPGSFAMRL